MGLDTYINLHIPFTEEINSDEYGVRREIEINLCYLRKFHNVAKELANLAEERKDYIKEEYDCTWFFDGKSDITIDLVELFENFYNSCLNGKSCSAIWTIAEEATILNRNLHSLKMLVAWQARTFSLTDFISSIEGYDDWKIDMLEEYREYIDYDNITIEICNSY